MAILTNETFSYSPPYLSGWIDHTVDLSLRGSVVAVGDSNKLRLSIEPDDFAFLGHRAEIRYNSNLVSGEEHRYSWKFTIPVEYIDNDPALFTIMGQIHDNSLTNSSPVTFRHANADLAVVEAAYPTQVAQWKLRSDWSSILLPNNTVSVIEMHVLDLTASDPNNARSVVGVAPVIRGQEFSMILEIKGATDATGTLKWWFNYEKLVDLKFIPTLWDESHDVDAGLNPHRFTVGIYQDTLVKNSNYVYIDNLKIETDIRPMAVTYEDTVADGVQTDFTIIFPYLSRDHVEAKFNGTAQDSSIFTFLSDTQIRFNSPPASGITVRVGRNTPQTTLTNFQDGYLPEADLDAGYLQNLYHVQELQDIYNDLIAGVAVPTPLLLLQDADADTMVQVEASADEDIIRFTTAGVLRARFDSSGNLTLGLDAAGDGPLHVHSSSAGAVAAHVDANEGVFESSGNTGITILSGTTSTGKIAFGDSADNDIMLIQANHSGDKLSIIVAGVELIGFSGSEIVLNETGSASLNVRMESDTNANMFFLDTANNRIGIGTNTPSTTFSVAGDSALGGSVIINEGALDKDTRIESVANDHMFFVDASTNRIGIGTAAPTDGLVHIQSGSAGTIAANALADEVVIEGSGNTGLSLLAPNTSSIRVLFGDPDNNAIGGLTYDHSADTLVVTAGNQSAFKFGTSENVHNEDGNDTNLRMESQNNTSKAILDAGTDAFQVAANTAATALANIGGVLYNSPSLSSTGAGTAEQTLKSYTVPANTLKAAGNCLRVTYAFVCAANTNSKTIRVKVGATTVYTLTTTTSGAVGFCEFLIKQQSTNVQVAYTPGLGYDSDTGAVLFYASVAEDETGAFDIKITGQDAVDSAGDITAEHLMVEVLDK